MENGPDGLTPQEQDVLIETGQGHVKEWAEDLYDEDPLINIEEQTMQKR